MVAETELAANNTIVTRPQAAGPARSYQVALGEILAGRFQNNPVLHAGRRSCVSNYFYSPAPGEDFHVTSFRAPPGHRVRDLLLRADGVLRNGLRRLFRKGVVRNWHYYDQR